MNRETSKITSDRAGKRNLMVPPIFVDMLVFRMCRRTTGLLTGEPVVSLSNSPPGPSSKACLRYLVGWVQAAASASAIVVDIVCNGSRFTYPSEDTPAWSYWSRKNVNTTSATVSKGNVGSPDRPRLASS
ncbi:hypothetical protein FJTKL_04164 [Diaporthe vaccinii]|uniref:Uncharacterized protein n=1 Tax=Diaporthe vaccinii TaxID=105482 RepID=A0ABR4DTC4_9PEZI